MSYIVYKTTNKINGKFYIGVHKVEDEKKDSYLGSGKRLALALNKYGRENFERETLRAFENKEEAFKYENELVNENTLCEAMYNLAPGGKGGDLISQNPNREEILAKAKERGKEMGARRKGISYEEFYGKSRAPLEKKKRSDSLQGHNVSDETRQKLSQSLLGQASWNKGLTKEDPRVRKNKENARKWRSYIITINGDEIILIGQKAYEAFIRDYNKRLPRGQKLDPYKKDYSFVRIGPMVRKE